MLHVARGVAPSHTIRPRCAHHGIVISLVDIPIPRIRACVLRVRLNAEPPTLVKQFDGLWSISSTDGLRVGTTRRLLLKLRYI